VSRPDDGPAPGRGRGTRLHNDHLTSGLELSRRVDAAYPVAAGPKLGFDAVRVRDGDLLPAANCAATCSTRMTALSSHTVSIKIPSGDGRMNCTSYTDVFDVSGVA
jgi:hydroxyacylglutathione hydrolase